MIGIAFIEFLLLFIISIVVAAILQQAGIFPKDKNDLIFNTIIGWLGGWLGSPVFGYWFEPLSYESIYILPAIIGSFAAIIIVDHCCRYLKSSAS